MSDKKAVKNVLKKYGFERTRRAQHGYFWENPEGARVLLSASPSDTYACRQQIRDIEDAVAGINRGQRRSVVLH